MKFKDFIKSLFLPRWMMKYKSMSIIVSICIFVISSFIIALPPSQNSNLNEQTILNNYNYEVLNQFPDTLVVNSVIKTLVDKECQVEDGKELKCNEMAEVDNYEANFSFQHDGITKNVYFVIDLFDIEQVYLEVEGVKVYYDPDIRFTMEQFPYVQNEENYLMILYSDALYFQAHPDGIDQLNVEHNGIKLHSDTKKVFYQNNIGDFSFSIDNPEQNGYQLGNYLLDQIIIGNKNTIKLQFFTYSFIVGVCFTTITILILWVFFHRQGKFKRFQEYYNIGAIASIPVTLIFFVLLWFIPKLLDIYILAFSLYYLSTLSIINNDEALV
ncbi:MAG: hypothetical protein PHP65_02930 [Bacilli bacterium]|nr:hypothetical protein [Bacilli bacterium]